ncbi:MAG: TonB family protein [Mesorhizobium sp.]|uniref:energy transducer TonB family protein n=1 Tax=Mesorhizobium sp. TaxID=1871066 RepID=UPI000FE49B01|nr:energy transducer TonB [Mesorhizobium sp.]RWP43140.1 MAG: TonB family protein [Mesorhizobium sp.]
MRTGLTTSVILHAVAIGFGLFTLSAPAALPASDAESLAVEIVPMEAIAQIQKGDKKAAVSEKPAPLPTQRPDIVADAKTVGDNSVDTDKPPTPEPKPQPVDMAEAPPPAPTPKEKPKPEDVPKPKEQPKPVPATEVAPVPQPKEEVKPEPVKQAEPKPTPAKEPAPTPPQDKTAAIDPKPEVKPDAVAEAIAQEPPTDTTQLPDSAPAPQARPKPQPAQAESAKAPERKDADKPVKEASSKPKSEEKQFDADEVAALLDKRKPSGGGAKRSTQQASLGDKDQGQKLSKSEEGALRDQLAGCWSIPAGVEGSESYVAVIRFNLDASGKLDGRPAVEKSSGSRPFDESAVRAVQKCDMAGLQVPAGKQDIWADVRVTFDPREMLGL